MRIMMLVPKLVWEGGGDRQAIMLAHELQKREHKVVIYTARYEQQSCFPQVSRKLDIRVIGTSGEGGDARKMARVISEQMEEAKESFDIINCHIHPMQWVASYLKKEKKMPVVWMCNDLPAWFLPFLTRKEIGWKKTILYRTLLPWVDHSFVKRVDAIVVFSKREQQKVRDYYKKDAYVIHSGIDIGGFSGGHRDKTREQYGIDSETVLLLCVSLLGPNRRTEDVIVSLRLLVSRGYKVKLMVVGGEYHYPGYTEVLRRCAQENEVKEKVIFAGSVPNTALPDYYAACDIFVYPHIHQSWGLAPAEAMAARRPTVVSKDPGISSLLTDYETSLLVAPKNPELLSQRIAGLMQDDALREKLVVQGYDFVKRNLSWEKYTDEMLKVFQRFTQE